MGLSADLIEQFVKVTNDRSKQKVDTTTFGTTVVKGDKVYVKLDGSEVYTPVSTTAHLIDGERVMVTIKNHTAIVTGNLEHPAVSLETEIKDGENGSIKIVNLGISMHDGFVKIDNLMAENFEAVNATIENLSTKYATIENLNATNATIGKLDAKYATIENLNAANATIGSLNAELGNFKNLTADNFSAVNGSIINLQTTKLDAETANIKYAQIDFANIGEAAIKNFIAESGIIKELTVSEGYITHELIGVKIKGDLIEANTLVADKLVILGDDGLYYKLNTNGEKVTSAQTDRNSLNGSIITAKSVTAEKIKVDDLEAFGATIGGFKITTNSIYSGSKATIGNTTRGIYLDNDGQIALGDSSNYLKFYKDGSAYKLTISADSVLFGGSKKSIETAIEEAVGNVEIGGRNLIPSAVLKNITGDSTESFTARAWAGILIDSTDLLQIIEPNTEYTLYYEAEIIERTDVPTLFSNASGFIFYSPSGAVATTSLYAPAFGSDEVGSKVWCSHTFVTPATLPSDYRMLIYTRRWTTNGNAPYGFDRIRFTKFKLEKGNKATDWTPAPEDVDIGISNAQSTANTARQEASDAAKTASNFLYHDASKGLIIGDIPSKGIEYIGRNVLIDNDSVDIRNGDTVLASYGDNTIYLAKGNDSAVIDLCNGVATMQNSPDPLIDQPMFQIHSDYEINLDSMYRVQAYTSYNENVSWGQSYFSCRSHNPNYLPLSREDSSYLSRAFGGLFKAVAYRQIGTNSNNIYGDWCELKLGEGKAQLCVYNDTGFIEPGDNDWTTRITLNANKSIDIVAEQVTLKNNSAVIQGVSPVGEDIPAFQAQNENGNTVVGWGNYEKVTVSDDDQGNTNLYGQDVYLGIAKANKAKFRPYYRKGDSITLLWYGAGYVSSSSGAVYVSIPLGKPVIGSPNVEVTSNEGVCIRQGGHYCYGSSSDTQYVKPSSYSNVTLAADGTQVRMRINMSGTTNAINNEACGIAASIKITFS